MVHAGTHTCTPNMTQQRLLGLPIDRAWCVCGAELRRLKGEWTAVGGTLTPKQIAGVR